MGDRPSSWAPSCGPLLDLGRVGEDRSTPSIVPLCAAAAQHMIHFVQLMQARKVTAPA